MFFFSKNFVELPGKFWALDPSVPLEERVHFGKKNKAFMKYPERIKDMFAGKIIPEEQGPTQTFKRIRLEKQDVYLESKPETDIPSSSGRNLTEIVTTTDKNGLENTYLVNNAYFRHQQYLKDPLSHARITNKISSNMDNYEVFGEEVTSEPDHLSLREDEIDVKVETIFSDQEIFYQNDLLEIEDRADANQ